jgi:hypothetical protein
MKALLPALFLSATLHAQEQPSFIEVMVTDTATAPVERILYTCNVMPDYSAVYAETPVTWGGYASPKEQRKMQEEMKKIQDSACVDQSDLNLQLEASGFRIHKGNLPQQHYTVNAGYGGECAATGTVVDLATVAELERLIAFIRVKGNVSGYVVAWEEDRFTHDQAALERLYRMAREQALRIAALDEQQLGLLISAEERTDDRELQDAYARAQGIVNYAYQPVPTDCRRSMTFRFEILKR